MADFDVEPLAENRIGGAEEDRGEDNAPAEGAPTQLPREHPCYRQRDRRNQNIAAGAMKERADNLARGAGAPQGVKRQLRRLPKKSARSPPGRYRARPEVSGEVRNYRRTLRKRSALVTTSTELMLMAALAIIGLRSKPSAG